MEAEYFPPKEEVILQNEAPTDMYIMVSGAVVSWLIDSICYLKLKLFCSILNKETIYGDRN